MPPNFQKLLSRQLSVLQNHILITAWNDAERTFRCTGLQERMQDQEILGRDFYFDFRWMDAITEKCQQRSPQLLQEFITAGMVYGEKLKTFVRGLAMSGDRKENQKIFWESVELMKDLSTFLGLTHPIAKAVENRVVDILNSKGVPESERASRLLEISHPTKPNGPVEEEISLRAVKRLHLEDPHFDIENALLEHAREFAYLGYREPFSEGYSVDFFRQRLNDISPHEPEQKETDLVFTTEEQAWVKLLQDFVFFRNYRTERFYEALYYLEPLWKRLALDYGLGETDLAYYLLDECQRLFSEKIRVPESVIQERKRGYGLLLHENKLTLITGAELQAQKTLREASGVGRGTDLKGMVASRGRARGTVKIVLSSSEQDKVCEGDILVTSMTTPDFLPAMKRAAAFVTDEGGVTCHAAIVSRELGKPCVIGTKVATQVLKDGDQVEVDAEEGRVIKKN